MTNIEPAILHYCRYQERCHSEVRNKLYDLGFTTVAVEEQMAALINAGHLNEERFARAFARGRWRLKQWGINKIKSELKKRKISEYCIKKGLSEIDLDEYDKVLQSLMARKWEEIRGERNIFIKKGKVLRFMLQKGYEMDKVTEVLNRL